VKKQTYAVNQVHEADCLEFLRTIPTGSVQLVIADPPYNIGPTFGVGREWQNDSQWLPWCQSWLIECQRILSDDGNLFVYGIHHYLCFLQVYLYEVGMKYRRQIIWHYENGFSRSRKTLATHYEPILWFSKSQNFFFKEIREPYKSIERLKHPVKMSNGKTWTPNAEGRIAGDVWKYPVLAGRRFRDEKVDHPTQKPLELTNRIIKHFSDADATVVVPFAGSGTECVSAYANGRDFLACDINPQYVELAQQRLLRAAEAI